MPPTWRRVDDTPYQVSHRSSSDAVVRCCKTWSTPGNSRSSVSSIAITASSPKNGVYSFNWCNTSWYSCPASICRKRKGLLIRDLSWSKPNWFASTSCSWTLLGSPYWAKLFSVAAFSSPVNRSKPKTVSPCTLSRDKRTSDFPCHTPTSQISPLTPRALWIWFTVMKAIQSKGKNHPSMDWWSLFTKLEIFSELVISSLYRFRRDRYCELTVSRNTCAEKKCAKRLFFRRLDVMDTRRGESRLIVFQSLLKESIFDSVSWVHGYEWASPKNLLRNWFSSLRAWLFQSNFGNYWLSSSFSPHPMEH
jgi:hypothetical protein